CLQFSYLFLLISSSSTAPATPQISTLSLHDALPISAAGGGPRDLDGVFGRLRAGRQQDRLGRARDRRDRIEPLRQPHIGLVLQRSEEHTSELQSQSNLVCRLLLEKKKYKIIYKEMRR